MTNWLRSPRSALKTEVLGRVRFMKEYGLERVEVVGLGQACVDYLGSVVTYPSEDRKIELTDLRIRCGGPASTALVTLSRLGIPTSFLGAVSDDAFGVKIIESLKREKIDSSSLIIRPGYTFQFSFISVTEGTGRRTIFWHRGSKTLNLTALNDLWWHN